MSSNQIRSKKESINGRFAKEDSYSNITKQPQQKRIYTWAIHHKMQNKYTYTSLCLPSYPYRNHSSSPHPLFKYLTERFPESLLPAGWPTVAPSHCPSSFQQWPPRCWWPGRASTATTASWPRRTAWPSAAAPRTFQH